MPRFKPEAASWEVKPLRHGAPLWAVEYLMCLTCWVVVRFSVIQRKLSKSNKRTVDGCRGLAIGARPNYARNLALAARPKHRTKFPLLLLAVSLASSRSGKYMHVGFEPCFAKHCWPFYEHCLRVAQIHSALYNSFWASLIGVMGLGGYLRWTFLRKREFQVKIFG